MQDKPETQTKDFLIALLAIIILIALLYLAFTLIRNNTNNKSYEETYLVVNITDGDTFEIGTGEYIRLICVNSPEKNKENYTEAKNFLSELILGKEVILKIDENVSAQETYDKYNRLLRYVYLIDKNNKTIFINKEVFKSGFSSLYPYGNSTSKCDEIAGLVE
jgi:endonuclease YncB( thermonuclease family)